MLDKKDANGFSVVDTSCLLSGRGLVHDKVY